MILQSAIVKNWIWLLLKHFPMKFARPRSDNPCRGPVDGNPATVGVKIPRAMREAAERDLMHRMTLGSVTYLILMALLGTVTPYRVDNPGLFWGAGSAILLSIGLRTVAIQLRLRGRRVGADWTRALVYASVCAGAGLLGLVFMTTALFYGFASWTFAITALWTMGIATGSTISFTPDLHLMSANVGCLLLPSVAYGIVLRTGQGGSFALSVGTWLLFLYVQGLHTHRLYWGVIRERATEAEQKRELLVAKAAAEQAREEMRFQATHDPLTGTLNRGELLAQLRKEMNRTYREREQMALIMIDIDHFKQVNDRHGHLAGDDVLGCVAVRIQRAVRSYDLLGRYGGEEFLVVMPRCSAAQAMGVAQRILVEISGKPVKVPEHEVQVTASAGCASFCPQEDEGEQVHLARVDAALYEAKRQGRNRVVEAGRQE